MSRLEDVKNHEECKKFLREALMNMINDLVKVETQLVKNYHEDRTIPLDFYNYSIRDISTRIQSKRDVYKYLTGEELK